MPKATALLATFALLSGCFGYNRGAKGWAYVGDAALIVGGGVAIGGDLATKPGACDGSGCPLYTPPLDGELVVGVVLVAAGIAGMIFNATRKNVKTSR